jgi:hypothetical protein
MLRGTSSTPSGAVEAPSQAGPANTTAKTPQRPTTQTGDLAANLSHEVPPSPEPNSPATNSASPRPTRWHGVATRTLVLAAVSRTMILIGSNRRWAARIRGYPWLMRKWHKRRVGTSQQES